jgi:hypothetical protein
MIVKNTLHAEGIYNAIFEEITEGPVVITKFGNRQTGRATFQLDDGTKITQQFFEGQILKAYNAIFEDSPEEVDTD